jgi:hypothetical protein
MCGVFLDMQHIFLQCNNVRTDVSAWATTAKIHFLKPSTTEPRSGSIWLPSLRRHHILSDNKSRVWWRWSSAKMQSSIMTNSWKYLKSTHFCFIEYLFLLWMGGEERRNYISACLHIFPPYLSSEGLLLKSLPHWNSVAIYPTYCDVWLIMRFKVLMPVKIKINYLAYDVIYFIHTYFHL